MANQDIDHPTIKTYPDVRITEETMSAISLKITPGFKHHKLKETTHLSPVFSKHQKIKV